MADRKFGLAHSFGPMRTLKGKNGTFEYNSFTQVAIRDSRGNVQVFGKSERSHGTVNNRLYQTYNSKRYDYGDGKGPKGKKKFVAKVMPFDTDPNAGFTPYVVQDRETK